MTTLLLRFAAPLQAWGTSSRFAYRFTDPQPSKSAVLGLLAAAQGRRRSEPIEDLLILRFGVRCDQPGTLIRDFQTARALDESYSLPLTYRFYLGDAAFIAAVEGDDDVIEGLAQALRRPAFPLYLGRRSCPPSWPIFVDVRNGSFDQVLRSVDEKDGAPWIAAEWYRRRQGPTVDLEIIRDVIDTEQATSSAADVPVSFDPHQRRYRTRDIIRETVIVDNDLSRKPTTKASGPVTEHDPFRVVGA